MPAPHLLLIHGAFRGGWAWEPLQRELAALGTTSSAPTLTGCEPDSDRVGSIVSLQEWIDDVVTAIDAVSSSPAPVVLVAHSQAGLPVRAALELRAADVARVIYLDAAVPLDGDRGVDLNPPGVPSPPDDIDPALWIPARPVGIDQGFTDAALAAFVNERLVGTPIGPSLDRVTLRSAAAAAVVTDYAFFEATPPTYPCQMTRIRLDAAHGDYTVLTGPHDAPITAAPMVARYLVSAATS